MIIDYEILVNKVSVISGDTVSMLLIYNNLTGVNFGEDKEKHDSYLRYVGEQLCGDGTIFFAKPSISLNFIGGRDIARHKMGSSAPIRVISASTAPAGTPSQEIHL